MKQIFGHLEYEPISTQPEHVRKEDQQQVTWPHCQGPQAIVRRFHLEG